MTPAELAAKVAAQKAATLARLQPMKQQARANTETLHATARGLKKQATDNHAEREIISNHPFDLFPTPPELAAEMVGRAGVRQGDRVLEPSAGTGRIAKAIKEAGGWAVCVELNYDLVNRLAGLGFDACQSDFMEYAPAGTFDAVIMNPPFSNGQDIDHVRHAYDLLTEGRLVAIMSEGSFFRQDKKVSAFREWLDEVGGESETLPSGTFKQSGTGVNARLVTITK
jgi:methylase of polypeptide subunit release factors